MDKILSNAKEIFENNKKIIIPTGTFILGMLIGLFVMRTLIISKYDSINSSSQANEELLYSSSQSDNNLYELNSDNNITDATSEITKDVSSVSTIVRVYDGEVQYYEEGQWISVDSVEDFVLTDPFIQYDLARVDYENTLIEEGIQSNEYAELFNDETITVGTIKENKNNGNAAVNNATGAVSTPTNQGAAQNNGGAVSLPNNSTNTNSNVTYTTVSSPDPVVNTPAPSSSNSDSGGSSSGSSSGSSGGSSGSSDGGAGGSDGGAGGSDGGAGGSDGGAGGSDGGAGGSDGGAGGSDGGAGGSDGGAGDSGGGAGDSGGGAGDSGDGQDIEWSGDIL